MTQLFETCITVLHSVKLTFRDNAVALSLPSFIPRDDSEVKLVVWTEMVGSKGVVCLSDVGIVDTCWVVLICHIVDEDRILNVITSYI